MAIQQLDARHRVTLDRAVTPRLTMGLEWNPSTGEVQPRGSWFATPQTRTAPSVALGATADRLSTARGHAAFATFAYRPEGSRLTPFVSFKYATASRMGAFPFGANLDLGRGLTFQAQNDGEYTHLVLSRSDAGSTVAVHLARTRHPGLQITLRR